MVILAQRWAEKYMATHPDVSIQVTGGGSGTGISALINGTTDICNASRKMKAAEREKLKQRFSSLGVEVPSARDGLAVYLNDGSPVSELTLDQVKEIYTGKLTNWKDVGGPDAKIVLYGRENNSGTYVYFRDNVLKGADFAPGDAVPARNGRGRERRVQGQARHRLRRRGLCQGHQVRQDQEGCGDARGRTHRRDRQERDLSRLPGTCTCI